MANNAAYDCVRALLCPLGDGVITALKGFVNAILLQIDAQILAVEALLLTLNPAYQAALVAFNVLEATLNEMEQYANLIPASFTDGSCITIGLAGADLRDTIDELTEEIREAKREVLLRLSLKNYYDQYLEELQQKRDSLQDWIDNLDCTGIIS